MKASSQIWLKTALEPSGVGLINAKLKIIPPYRAEPWRSSRSLAAFTEREIALAISIALAVERFLTGPEGADWQADDHIGDIYTAEEFSAHHPGTVVWRRRTTPPQDVHPVGGDSGGGGAAAHCAVPSDIPAAD